MRTLLILSWFLLAACVSGDKSGSGDWRPLQDTRDKKKHIEKYEMIGFDDVFSGLVFWEISPRIDEAPYSFHISSGRVRVWDPRRTGKVQFRINFDECRGLEERALELKRSIQESVGIAFNDQERYEVYAGSPNIYRVKYFPKNMLGSITLNNLLWDDLPWMKKAIELKELLSICAEGKRSS